MRVNSPGSKAQRSMVRSEASRIKQSITRKELYRKERLRIKWGLPQKTKIRISFNNNAAVYNTRLRLKKRGYVVDRGGMVAYYTQATQRHDRMEARAKKRGFVILSAI